MSIKEELIQYAQRCLNDEYISEFEDYISCKKHKWACQRFLDDLKKSELNILKEPFNYYWDEEEAQKIVKWFSYLRHSKGVLAGKPIELTIWQKFDLCQIYGWRNKETGYKRFTKSFVEVARKNAKSQMEGGVLLYEISTVATEMGEMYEGYTSGTKAKQSRIVFDECKLMLKKSPLKTKFKLNRDRITHIKTDSFIEPLSKDDKDSGDGTNPAVGVVDEYHQHKTDDFYSLFDTGMKARKSPLLMIITTAGKDLNCPCYLQEYSYCSNILDPNVDIFNDEYFVDILELDKDDDITVERNWRKANPIVMTYKEGIKAIRDSYKIAIDIPEKMTDFLTKTLNIWVQMTDNSYMNMAKWKMCEMPKILEDTKGMDVFVGFDMSAKHDLTSIAFIVPVMRDGVKKYLCWSHSFVPDEKKLIEHKLKDRAPYDLWGRKKYITITNSDLIDQQNVMEYVNAICEKMEWRVNKYCFDPANATKIMTDMEAIYGRSKVVEVYQSPKSLNEATVSFREQVIAKNIIYEYNPVLNFAMTNAIIRKRNGLIQIDKDATIRRIDPVDAMLCAYKLALFYDVEKCYSPVKRLKEMDW